MDKNLFGKTILIGRDSNNSSLKLCVVVNGKPYSTSIGTPGAVPQSVSRCMPAENKAHCTLAIDNNGNIILTNINAANITFVDGLEVMRRNISETSTLQLSQQRFEVGVSLILQAVATMIAKQIPQTVAYSIAHLEQVYDDFNKRNDDIEHEQMLNNLLTRVPFIISTVGGIVTGVAKSSGNTGLGSFTLILSIAGLLVLIYGTYKTFKQPASKARRENLNLFQEKYRCPNPNCGQQLKNYQYSELVKMGKCPYCKCKFE